MEDAIRIKNYVLISHLIKDVLTSKLTVAEALLQFPKDKSDINIKCVFDALVYREADEDLRRTQKGYALVQDEYLLEISQILERGEGLPQNIISQYYKYNSENLLSEENDFKMNFKNIMKSVKKMISF